MDFPDPATLASPEDGAASEGSASGNWPDVPDAPPMAVGTLFGGYRIVRVVGGGGMGQVYEAFDAELARAVALKVMRPERAAKPDARERFLREARALAAVSNPHVVAIHHVGQHDGQPFLVMELITGETLDARMRVGPPAVVQLVQTAREIATGLAAAHRAGVIHRDIKPDNVIVTTPDGVAKLIDFGLAHTARVGGDGRRTVGTPLYMSPEQVLGQPVTVRSDLFSLGVLLYRMASGKLPFEGASLLEWRTRLLSPQPPEPVERHNPAVPPPLADLIHRLLAKEPESRPESARAVEWELGTLLQTLVSQSGAFTSSTPRPLTDPSVTSNPGGLLAVAPTRSVRPWVWAAVAGVLLATLAVVVFALTRPRTDPETLQPTTQSTPPKLPPAVGKPITLFDGKTLAGWRTVGGAGEHWSVRNGAIVGTPKPGGDQFLLSDADFGEYVLSFEFRWPDKGSHTFLHVRAGEAMAVVDGVPMPSVDGLEVNLFLGPDEATNDEERKMYSNWLYAAGGVHALRGPIRFVQNVPLGKWNTVKVTNTVARLKVEWNGQVTFDEELANHPKKGQHPALDRTTGGIALRTHGVKPLEYRNLVVTPIGR